MTLQEKLDGMAATSKEKLPADALAVMNSQLQDLIDSGQAGRAVGIGVEAPGFTLPGPDGDVSLADLTNKGPVVMTWFRGSW